MILQNFPCFFSSFLRRLMKIKVIMKEKPIPDFHKIETPLPRAILQGKVYKLQFNLFIKSHCDPVDAIPVIGVLIRIIRGGEFPIIICILFKAHCEKKEREKWETVHICICPVMCNALICAPALEFQQYFVKIQDCFNFEIMILKFQMQPNPKS